jgi:hypothetical protein
MEVGPRTRTGHCCDGCRPFRRRDPSATARSVAGSTGSADSVGPARERRNDCPGLCRIRR